MRILQKLSQGIKIMSRKTVNSSAERNKEPIFEVIKKYLKPCNPGDVLEISSGTGQHVTYFAPHFPYLKFQPSENDRNMLEEIKLYIEDCPSKNIKQPLHIDITTDIDTWGLDTKEYNYIININMIHISPYACTKGLFRSAGQLLVKNGLLITYGPYAVNGNLTPQSNVNFDKFLRQQNPEWGVRDVGDLEKEAEKNGLRLIDTNDMPANNKTLIWQKL